MAFVVFFAISASALVSASEKPIDMLNQLHDGVCQKHEDPELCKRLVSIIMKGVKLNDDVYIECIENKPSKPEDAMACQSSREIRSMIDTYK